MESTLVNNSGLMLLNGKSTSFGILNSQIYPSAARSHPEAREESCLFLHRFPISRDSEIETPSGSWNVI